MHKFTPFISVLLIIISGFLERIAELDNTRRLFAFHHQSLHLYLRFYRNSRYSERRLMLSLVSVISRLMWSNLNVPYTKDYLEKIIGYCYRSVNVITFVQLLVITLSGFYCIIKAPSCPTSHLLIRVLHLLHFGRELTLLTTSSCKQCNAFNISINMCLNSALFSAFFNQ